MSENHGAQLTWPDAEKLLMLTRPTIQKLAWDELANSMPGATPEEIEQKFAEEGVSFRCGKYWVWIFRPSRNYKISIRPANRRRNEVGGEEEV